LRRHGWHRNAATAASGKQARLGPMVSPSPHWTRTDKMYSRIASTTGSASKIRSFPLALLSVLPRSGFNAMVFDEDLAQQPHRSGMGRSGQHGRGGHRHNIIRKIDRLLQYHHDRRHSAPEQDTGANAGSAATRDRPLQAVLNNRPARLGFRAARFSY